MGRFIPRNYDDWKTTDPRDYEETAPEPDPDELYERWRDEQMQSDK